MELAPAVWFPTVRTNTGTDIFTERLVKELNQRGIRAEITWLPLRSEYAPWTVPLPEPPNWATIAHVNTWLHPRFAPKTLPFVATIHHSVHHRDALSYKGWLRAAYHKYWIAPIEREIMKRAAKVIAVSHFVADTARQTLADVPIEVIYNGIDTTIFKPGNRIRTPGEPFRLLYVGSWTARKGVDLLAPIMRELGQQFELQYTGGPAAEKDKSYMPTNMKDIGRLSGDAEVARAMQNSDAFLFPSRSEGHPLVAIEAIACGIPVVATRGSSLTEVIKDHQTGVLCRQDDVHAFTKAVRRIASTPTTAPRQPSAATLSIGQNCSSHLAIYRIVLEKNPV